MSSGCPMMMLQPPPALATKSTPPSPTAQRKNITLGITQNQAQRNAQAEKKKRSAKRKLGPGCSLMDWIRLCRSKKDLGCNGGVPKPVTEEELAQHNTPDDAWTAIRGKVYNLTPYMKFHPGGMEDLMKGAGKDCTILFDEVHKWVNVESMLKACYVGPLEILPPGQSNRSPAPRHRNSLCLTASQATAASVNKLSSSLKTVKLRTDSQAADACEEPDGQRQVSPESPSKSLVHDMPRKSLQENEKHAAEDASVTLSVPSSVRMRKNSDASRPNPRFDWVQSEKAIIIHVKTNCSTLKTSDVVMDVSGNNLEAAIFLNDWVYEIKIALSHTVVSSQVSINAGRVEISLKKEPNQEEWKDIGSFLYGHGGVLPKSRRDPKFRASSVASIKSVTYDTKLFTLRLRPGSFLQVPTGHHVTLRADVSGEEIERDYTPVCTLADTAKRQPQAQHQAASSDTIQMMIKLYKDGKMSGYLDKLKVGDEVLVSDPEGTFDAARLVNNTNILLVAAGSGFTPMVQVLNDALSTPGEHLKTKLLFANKTEEDILWKDELDQVSNTSNGRFEVSHVLSAASSGWNGIKGRIDHSLIKAHLPETSKDKTLVCVCGPQPFTTAVSNYLLDMNFPDDCVHCFM